MYISFDFYSQFPKATGLGNGFEILSVLFTFSFQCTNYINFGGIKILEFGSWCLVPIYYTSTLLCYLSFGKLDIAILNSIFKQFKRLPGLLTLSIKRRIPSYIEVLLYLAMMTHSSRHLAKLLFVLCLKVYRTRKSYTIRLYLCTTINNLK